MSGTLFDMLFTPFLILCELSKIILITLAFVDFSHAVFASVFSPIQFKVSCVAIVIDKSCKNVAFVSFLSSVGPNCLSSLKSCIYPYYYPYLRDFFFDSREGLIFCVLICRRNKRLSTIDLREE